jgi:signal transduction histidine kinase
MEQGVLSRLAVECSALGFQSLITCLLALACFGLWRRQHRPYFLTWSLAWGLYALRLASMSTYLVHRDQVWLAVHQALTGLMSLLLLFAALQFSRGARWNPRYMLFGVAALLWGWVSIYVIHSMMIAGIVSTLLLSGVTIWTGVAFWNYRGKVPSGAAPALAWTFWLWGLHHLDYPLLRRFGEGVFFGVFADVLFIIVTTIGTMFLVLGDERRKLATRNTQLEQLTRLLLSAQEDERRRIARELHDEAGQALTVVKMELDLDNRREASALVGKVLAQVRDLSNLLRPSALDDLGLLPALRSLVEDFARRTRLEATLETVGSARTFAPELEVTLYRVVQEALTNIIRHADARHVQVRLDVDPGEVRVEVVDDGKGGTGEVTPNLGLLFMRERITELGGVLDAGPVGDGAAGFRIQATIPLGAEV